MQIHNTVNYTKQVFTALNVYGYMNIRLEYGWHIPLYTFAGYKNIICNSNCSYNRCKIESCSPGQCSLVNIVIQQIASLSYFLPLLSPSTLQSKQFPLTCNITLFCLPLLLPYTPRKYNLFRKCGNIIHYNTSIYCNIFTDFLLSVYLIGHT